MRSKPESEGFPVVNRNLCGVRGEIMDIGLLNINYGSIAPELIAAIAGVLVMSSMPLPWSARVVRTQL